MNENFSNLGRCISICDRLMKMYYDHGLAEYEIGWGQQFYVEYLYEYPGASPQKMAERFRVDRATLSKTIKKLSEIGYITVAGDENDRRMKHLYLTKKAIPAAKQIKKIHADFYETVSAGIRQQDLELTEQILQEIANNINKKVWHRMEEHHGE